MRSELPDDFFTDCNNIAIPDDLIMEIEEVEFYNPINIAKPYRVELLNCKNGQLIIVNVDTKKYIISHINLQKIKTNYISFNLKNKKESKLYYFSKQAYNDFYRIGDFNCCLIN